MRPFTFIGGTSEPGGVHVHTVDVARALVAAGHPARIVNTSIDHFSTLAEGSGVTVRSVATPADRSSIARFRAWRSLLHADSGRDLVWINGTAGEGDAADLLAAWSRAARLYSIEHRPEVRAQRAWHALAFRRVRRAIAVSPATGDALVTARGLSHGQVRICLNWIDDLPPQPRDAARARLGLAPDAFTIGFVGRMAPEKRVDVLIRAFARLDRPDARLVLIGDGWKRADLESLTAGLGLSSRVDFRGWQPDPRSLLSALDLFVLPSLIEGFPLALMEAMSAGCACLAHPMDSTRLLFAAEAGIFADCADDATLAAALTRAMFRSDGARHAIGERARAHVTTAFSRERRLPDVLKALDAPAAAARAARPGPRTPRRLTFAARP